MSNKFRSMIKTPTNLDTISDEPDTLLNKEFTFARNEYTENQLCSIIMKRPRMNRNIKAMTETVGHEFEVALLE